MTFEELGLSAPIIRAVTELGFVNPMPVQEQVIPLLLAHDTDIVALAQTGTGKTAAFGLPIVHQIDIALKKPQALILCPTRELCMQVASDLASYSKYLKGLHVLPVYGGAPISTQASKVREGVHILVATPGRLIDLMERKIVRLDHVHKVILDEADEMLNMGFTDSITTIFESLPEVRNTLLFSATMPPEIARIAKKYMSDAREITVGNKNMGAENIRHICHIVHARDKYAALKRIADFYPEIYGIVFCRTRKDTQEIADKLIQDGYSAEALHGDLSQSQRDFVMNKFRLRNLHILVATDVAARGIDVNDLSHVIQYNLPDEAAAYTHRSGRTGRAGKEGISIAIINVKEKNYVRQIERTSGITFEWAKVPGGKEICEKQLFNLIDKIDKIEVGYKNIAPYLPIIKKRLDIYDKDELIQRFLSVEFNRFLDYYKAAPDIDIADHRSDSRDIGRSSGKAKEGYGKLYINIGKVDGLFPNHLMEIISEHVKDGRQIAIGKVDIFQKHTIFEAPLESMASLKALSNELVYDDRKIVIREDAEDGVSPAKRRDNYQGSDFKRQGERRSYNDRNSGGDSRNSRGGEGRSSRGDSRSSGGDSRNSRSDSRSSSYGDRRKQR